MRILCYSGKENVAFVYVGELKEGRYIEFSESLEPPLPMRRSGF